MKRDLAREGPPLVLSEIGLCYFAALIDGLRLIDEKAEEGWTEDFDASALAVYVSQKGERIAKACYSMEEYDRALRTPAVMVPMAGKVVPFVKQKVQFGKKRNLRKSKQSKVAFDWNEVDWRLCDSEIARRQKCTASSVYYARKRCGSPRTSGIGDRRSVARGGGAGPAIENNHAISGAVGNRLEAVAKRVA